VCATITTTRKFFTILLSVLMHPENVLAPVQWGAVALVFSGLGGEIHGKWSKGKGGTKTDKYEKVPGTAADEESLELTDTSLGVTSDEDLTPGRSSVEMGQGGRRVKILKV